MAEPKRVEIRCPECDAMIASAPADDLPVGDLVCPNCAAVLEAPTALDKFVATLKARLKDALEGPDGDKPD